MTHSPPPHPWLTILGIGEDGVDGLSPAARLLLDQADILMGGSRHLAMVPANATQRLPWVSPFSDNLQTLAGLRGRKVCVLASGDPQWFGVGVTLARAFTPGEITVIPHPGAFSLAAARLSWALQDCTCLTIHGRPLDGLALHLYPGARLLVLSENAASPAKVATFLTERGWGQARLTVLERLDGSFERIISGQAGQWAEPAGDDLNCLAIDLGGITPGTCFSRLAGLPDDAFEHDGQLTKREIRAVTLSSLAPWPGAVLWDVGAGCGSIAIEWARAGGRAVAFERDEKRLAMIARNAVSLGVSTNLTIVEGTIPDSLSLVPNDLPAPDAVFIGGGVSLPGLFDQCWKAMPRGGRLVANAVTTDSELCLLSWQAKHGGALSRLAVSRLGSTGRFQSWHPLMPVTHYMGIKP